MFSLVKFTNGKYSVLKSKHVKKIGQKTCTVTFYGGKFSACRITSNDNKSVLVGLKCSLELSKYGQCDSLFASDVRTGLKKQDSDIKIPKIKCNATITANNICNDRSDKIPPTEPPSSGTNLRLRNIDTSNLKLEKTTTSSPLSSVNDTIVISNDGYEIVLNKYQQNVQTQSNILENRKSEILNLQHEKTIHESCSTSNNTVLQLSSKNSPEHKVKEESFPDLGSAQTDAKWSSTECIQDNPTDVSTCSSSKCTRSSQIHRQMAKYIHPVANNALKSKIFTVLFCDEIANSIRYDELAIKFGNYMTEKYSSEHHYGMIRAKLWLLGRFIIEIKKLDPAINELKDIYKVDLFEICIKAIQNIASWNETLMEFETPAVAQNLYSIIINCGKRHLIELSREEQKYLETEVQDFLKLWEEEIGVINKKVI